MTSVWESRRATREISAREKIFWMVVERRKGCRVSGLIQGGCNFVLQTLFLSRRMLYIRVISIHDHLTQSFASHSPANVKTNTTIGPRIFHSKRKHFQCFPDFTSITRDKIWNSSVQFSFVRRGVNIKAEVFYFTAKNVSFIVCKDERNEIE